MSDERKTKAQLAAEPAAARRQPEMEKDTQEWERAEASLRQSAEKRKQMEEDLRSLALFPDENPSPILRISTDGTMLYANKASAKLLDFWGCQVGRPAPRALHQMVLEAVRSGPNLESEVRCRDQVFSFGSALVADRGYVNLYGRDVTANKRAEAELQKLNRALQAHTRSAHAMMRARNEAQYLQEVCKIVVEDCGRAMVWIGYAQEDAEKSVRPVAHSGFEEGYLEKLNVTWADTERGRGPTGTAIRTGKPCTCGNMVTDPAFAPWREEALKRGYASSLVLPLMAYGRAFGAMTIYSPEPDAFSEDEVKSLSGLADDLAFGIAALRLREAHARAEEALRRSRAELEARVRERTRELTKSNRRLRESQRVIRQVADTTPDNIYIYDLASLQIVYANPRAAKFMGYSPDELRAMQPNFFEKNVHPDDRLILQEFRRWLATADESDVAEYECRAKRADGEWRWLLVRETLFARGPDRLPRQILGTALDITDRKEAEARLRETNALLELFAKVGSRKPYLESIAELLTRISGCSCVGVRLLNERGEIPYEASIGFSEEFLKSECWLSVNLDDCACTRVAVEKPQLQDEPMMTPKGSFCCNNTFEFLGGLSPEQQARFRGVCVKTGYATVAVFPLRFRDKVLGVIHCADKAPGRADPRAVEFLESMSPLIAEAVYRFNVEETLRDSEARVRAIFDHAFQFIGLLRPDGTILEVNQPALGFAGITLADVRDRPLWEAKWWSSSPEGQKQLKSSVADAAGGRFVRHEAVLRGAGEAVIVADFSVKPVLDGEGKVALLIAEARDITERKRLEREILEAAGREQRRIGEDLHDTLGQNLAGIAMLSRALQQKLAARSLREAQEAARITELAGEAAAQSRAIARGLRPVEISEHGLTDALRELAASTEKFFSIPCEFRCDTPAPVRDNDVATQLYSIAQEAVNNAVKHSGAKNIMVSLNRGPEMISLRVRDDGTGLPPNVAKADGMGLRIMRHRAEVIGGFLDVRNVLPHGTVVGCYVRSAGPQAFAAGAPPE